MAFFPAINANLGTPHTRLWAFDHKRVLVAYPRYKFRRAANALTVEQLSLSDAFPDMRDRAAIPNLVEIVDPISARVFRDRESSNRRLLLT